MFYSVLPVMGRDRKMVKPRSSVTGSETEFSIRIWDFKIMEVFEMRGLLGPDGIHLSQWDECFLAHNP